MKKLAIFITLTLLFITNTIAQTSYSCYYREICQWNQKTEKFDICDGYEEASIFVINKDVTLFKHTTESMKSMYYIDERKQDQENNLWTYYVTSDVGNKYPYVFDPVNKEVRVLLNKDGETSFIKFYVKAIF